MPTQSGGGVLRILDRANKAFLSPWPLSSVWQIWRESNWIMWCLIIILGVVWLQRAEPGTVLHQQPAPTPRTGLLISTDIFRSGTRVERGKTLMTLWQRSNQERNDNYFVDKCPNNETTNQQKSRLKFVACVEASWESCLYVSSLSTLADVIWGPPHTGLGPVSPSECPHRPVVPAEAAQTAACVLRTLATVTTIPATGAPAYCLQQHCCPSKETKLGVILLALAVNVSLRLILGYQIAYLGRKISSLHLILW